jgi:hypothetical protein
MGFSLQNIALRFILRVSMCQKRLFVCALVAILVGICFGEPWFPSMGSLPFDDVMDRRGDRSIPRPLSFEETIRMASRRRGERRNDFKEEDVMEFDTHEHHNGRMWKQAFRTDTEQLKESLSPRFFSRAAVGPMMAQASNTKDCNILASFYENMGGTGWYNQNGWEDIETLRTSCCDVKPFGVTCDVNGNVLALELEKNNLIGTFPKEMTEFSSIQTM